MLQPKARGPPGEFDCVLIYDGCSFAVKDALHKQYPAAVELYVAMGLPDGSVEKVTLTANRAGAGMPPGAVAEERPGQSTAAAGRGGDPER